MNRNPHHKAVADPVTLALVALVALAAGVFGTSWKPLEFMRPKPPVEELNRLQGQLAQAQADAVQARADKEAAVKAERSKLEAEVRSAQEDNAGTQAALEKAPAGAEVNLAKQMAVRVDMKLAVAIGDLPKANREAIVRLIGDALAGKDAEFQTAMAKRDEEFKALAKDRDALKAQLPVLAQKVAQAEATVQQVQVEKTKVENKVAAIATELDQEKREKGSFKGAAEKAVNWIMVIVGAWAFLSFVLPGLVKHMGEDNPLKGFLRGMAGLTTSPLLYLDARAKLNDLKQQLTNTPFPK